MQSTTKKLKKKRNSLVKKEDFTKFFVRVYSRHPSHNALRKSILLPFRGVVRFGSTTPSDIKVQCNSTEAVRNSADKRRMKDCFTAKGVITADWTKETNKDAILQWSKDKYPIVSKHRFGSRGTGNTLHDKEENLKAWLNGKDLNEYIFEKFYSYSREYRLHVTEDGCFYTCRKMLKNETPDDKRWFRNDSNSVWIIESNPQFEKPSNWKKIEEECVKALKSISLDIGAFDVRVQGKDKKDPKFIVIESGSAPSFGDITLQKYKEEIPKVLKKKYVNLV